MFSASVQSGSTAHSFDPSLYPRSYRVSIGPRVFFTLLGTLLAAGGLLGIWYFGTGHESRNPASAAILALLSFSFALLGGYLSLSILKSKLILFADAVEVQGPLSTRKLGRSDIVGRRILRTQYMKVLVLVPGSKDEKKLKISLIMESDAAFEAWFATLPDLDAEDLAKSEAQLESDTDIGVTREEVSERLGEARKIAKWFNWIAAPAVFWAWIYPRPYQLAIATLALLPLVVILLLAQSKGLYDVEGRRNDARPSLAFPFIGPGAILAVRLLQDFEFLHWERLLMAAVLAGFVLTVIVAIVSRAEGRRDWVLLVILLFAVGYCYGAIGEANVLLDRSAPQTFEAAVLGKHVSRGRSGTTWYLHLGPWGPRRGPSDVSVPYSLYRLTAPGETVCVELLPGALQIPWYYATTCG